MKAERRHELKENDLAHALGVAREYLDDHGARIGMYVLVAGIVFAAVAFGVRSRSASIEDVWRRKGQLNFTNAEVGRQSLVALASMTKDVSDETFIFSSLADQAMQALRLAREVPVPPDRELNTKAESALRQLLERFPDNPLAVGLAHSGLVTVEQNYFVLDGDLVHKERAAEHLAAIVENPALNGLPFKRIALERREALDEIFVTVSFEHPSLPPEAAGDSADAVAPADPVDTP